MRLPQLHDVRDPEAFCQALLNRVLGANGGHWNAAEREDVLQDMRVLLWRLSLRYDATKTTMTFSTYATWILTRRAGVDAYRTRLVDRRYDKGDRQPDISLDELRERAVAIEESDDTPTREQADVLTRVACALAPLATSAQAFESWVETLTPSEATA